MKAFTLLGALSIAFIATQATAEAQGVRKNETYCLETDVGGGGGGGGLQTWCAYETMAQCMASKVTHGDRCILNPVLAFEQRNERR